MQPSERLTSAVWHPCVGVSATQLNCIWPEGTITPLQVDYTKYTYYVHIYIHRQIDEQIDKLIVFVNRHITCITRQYSEGLYLKQYLYSYICLLLSRRYFPTFWCFVIEYKHKQEGTLTVRLNFMPSTCPWGAVSDYDGH